MRMILAVSSAVAVALAAAPVAAAPDRTLGPALLSAIVDADGNLVGGAGPVSAAQVGFDGQYEVIFARDVQDCTYVAMVGDAVFPRTSASTARRFFQPNGVFVVLSTGSTPVNAPFHLTVFCAR